MNRQQNWELQSASWWQCPCWRSSKMLFRHTRSSIKTTQEWNVKFVVWWLQWMNTLYILKHTWDAKVHMWWGIRHEEIVSCIKIVIINTYVKAYLPFYVSSPEFTITPILYEGEIELHRICQMCLILPRYLIYFYNCLITLITELLHLFYEELQR